MVGMDFSNERYVRVFTRDTMKWLGLSFEAQGLYCLLIRKADRSGVIDIEGGGRRAAAIIIGHPHRWGDLADALDELEREGLVVVTEKAISFVDFIEGQEATQSDAMRQKESRKRRSSSHLSRNVTQEEIHVTKRDEMSLQPSQPSQPNQETEKAVSKVVEMELILKAEYRRLTGKEYVGAHGRDRKALKSLLATNINDDEILLVWRKGIASQGYLRTGNIHELLTKWNALAMPALSPTGTARDMTRVVVGFHPETKEPIYGTNP